jgi:SAM-dependent methyltransferase
MVVHGDDARRLFTERRAAYTRFIGAVRYPQGLRAYFLASALLDRPNLRVLEAGCGTGALTLAVHDAAARRGVPLAALDIAIVRLAEADVLQREGLPESWRGYDLVVSASMLEYVPRARFAEALANLRARLRDGGAFVLFVTRRNPLTRILIGRWWHSNLYTRAELTAAFQRAGFGRVRFPGFPLAARHLSVWGHVVEALASDDGRG